MKPRPTLQIDVDAKQAIVKLVGALTVHQLADAQARLKAAAKKITPRQVDVSGLERLDTAGAFYLQQWLGDMPITFRDSEQEHLFAMMQQLTIAQVPPLPVVPPLRRWVQGVGRKVEAGRAEAVRMVTFMGQAATMLVWALKRPQRLRIGSVSQHIHAIGIEALPIIGLMAFLISVVLAYQGVAQLRPYGGEQFTVNLVALSILREMGVLLTAIMVAGRSGSAFTAEIGVMKAREEVDALQVMGLHPFALLVTPRLIAILIALPLLTFYADLMGLLGGFVITNSLIDISWPQYTERVHAAVSGSDLFVGLVKAPVFALVIAIVACMHGLRVSGSAESIGKETTASVVKSIFLVLMLDAFFSILFEKMGL